MIVIQILVSQSCFCLNHLKNKSKAKLETKWIHPCSPQLEQALNQAILPIKSKTHPQA